MFFQIVNIFPQQNDTIYIYETIHVVDTVWCESPVQNYTFEIHPLNRIENATLLLDTITQSASLIYFSSNKSATIPINLILTDENQLKHFQMKKGEFFTLMFLAFQRIKLIATSKIRA